MFAFLRKRKIKKYSKEAETYVRQKYIVQSQTDNIRYCLVRKDSQEKEKAAMSTEPLIKFQAREQYADVCRCSIDIDEVSEDTSESFQQKPKAKDTYDASEVMRLLRGYSTDGNFSEMLRTLEQCVNQTFVERLLCYITKKGARDAQVYKAAQVDKRLFSKMVGNREYKPSKDTAIALALALELSLEEANDLFSRAGYTLSHSNKRDIIIEFLFREKIYNLMDANEVLYRLDQKLIGCF